MIPEQKEFHTILLKEGIENRAFFTSNEFHTIWNAVEKYIAQIAPKNESVIPPVRLPYPLSSSLGVWQMAREMDSSEFCKYYDGMIKGMQP
jgi:hypothetical protein